MTIRATLLLAGAMLAGATSLANAATITIPATVVKGDDISNSGESVTAIFGGGSSLIAPYLRQAADCFGDKIDLGSNGSASVKTITSFHYLGTPPATCGTKGLIQPGSVVSYISTGSGRGFMGFFSHNPLYSHTAASPNGEGNADTWLTDGTAATPVSADPFYATKVNFAAADAGLPLSDLSFGGDINTYNNGGYVKANNISIQVADQNGNPPAASPAPSGTIISTVYPNPLKTYGPAIQIPLLVAAPVVAFSPVYKKVRKVQGSTLDTSTTETFYSFLVAGNKSASTPGALQLTNLQLCQIFTGKISNWNQLPATTVTKAVADPAAFDVPLQIVGRSDGSGTTSIVYRHLAKICTATLLGTDSAYTAGAAANNGNAGTKLPSSLRPNNITVDPANPNASPAGENPAEFTLANGSGGVANYLAFLTAAGPNIGDSVVQGRVGYLGEDFVLPYVIKNGQNKYSLTSASLQNFLGKFIASTPAAAAIATGVTVILPPQSTTTGAYSAPAGGSRADPAANSTKFTWVSAPNTASPLADPVTSGSYPLVGTTNGLFYQCYADATEAALVRSFLSWYYNNGSAATTGSIVTDKSKGILTSNGFAVVSPAYLKAINDTFLLNANSLGLDIGQSGASSPTAACTTVAGA